MVWRLAFKCCCATYIKRELHRATAAIDMVFGAASGMSRPRKECADRWFSGSNAYQMTVETQSVKLPDATVLTLMALLKTERNFGSEMLKPDALDSLFSILHEMTLVERKGTTTESPTKMQLLEKYLVGGYVIVTALLLLSALAQYVWPTPALAGSVRALYLALVLVSLGYLLSATANAAHFVWRARQQRFSWLLSPMRLDLQVDADYLTKLFAFDKPTLKYALLQYRYRFDTQESRISSLAGDVRKLGLFPAMAASTIAASTLLKNDGNVLIWMWIPLILAACFYPMAFYLYTQRERPQQVINLLELAIAHGETDVAAAQ